MPFVPPRPISSDEAAVLTAALTRARIQPPHHIDMKSISSLMVHSKCSCCCASVRFLPEHEKAPDETRLIADGRGFSAEGQEIGVLIFGTSHRVVDMEVYWYETDGAPLPLANTIGEFTADNSPT